MNIFKYDDYKKFLKDFIKNLNRRGTITELARACACTHSYLSQVLNESPELTPDQALAATDFLQLTSFESEYFLMLVLKSRAATPKLKKFYEDSLKLIEAKYLKIKTAVATTSDSELSVHERDIYYSNWTVPLIHILTSCPDYQTISSLSTKTQMGNKEVLQILDWLIQKKLVLKKEQRYIHAGKNIHLPADSVHNQINHLNWRLKARETFNDASALHYTSVFAVDVKDINKIKTQLLEFIEKQRVQITKSGSEDVMIFCCDLFQA